MNNGCIEFNQCNNRYGLQMENLEKLIAIVNRFYIISKNINTPKSQNKSKFLINKSNLLCKLATNISNSPIFSKIIVL